MGYGQLTGRYGNVMAKTASYTVTDADWGSLITNRGASGAVTITLPAPTTTQTGVWVDLFQVAGQNLVITAGTDLITTFNDATATSITYSTAGELIGNGARFVNDGTTWLHMPFTNEAATQTTA